MDSTHYRGGINPVDVEATWTQNTPPPPDMPSTSTTTPTTRWSPTTPPPATPTDDSQFELELEAPVLVPVLVPALEYIDLLQLVQEARDNIPGDIGASGRH